MENEVLNIFSFNNLSEKGNVFGENGGGGIFGGDMTIFKEKRSSYAKNEYNLFSSKIRC